MRLTRQTRQLWVGRAGTRPFTRYRNKPIAHLVRGKLRGRPIADLSPLMTDVEWLAWFGGSPAQFNILSRADVEPYTGECHEDGEP